MQSGKHYFFQLHQQKERLYSDLTHAALSDPSRRDSASGKTGLDLLIQFIAKLLDPSQTESAALFVGDLVSKLITKGDNLVTPILPDLLRAVTIRLADAKLPSFIQVMRKLFPSVLGSCYFSNADRC